MLQLENALANPDFNLQSASMGAVDQLLGEIGRMPKSSQASAVKALARNSGGNSANMTSRDHALAKIGFVPEPIRRAINENRYHLVDTVYYIVKSVDGKTSIKMLQDTDDKAPELGNISKAQLGKDNWFLMNSITLLSGVGVTAGVTAFDFIPAVIKNGNFKFSVNNRFLMPDSVSSEIFDQDNTSAPKGMFLLDNPKWIEPQQTIALDLEWNTAAIANTWVKAIFRGTSVIPF